MLQAETRDHLRGRVFASRDVLWQTGRLISLGLAAVLADTVGVSATNLLGGVLLLLTAGFGSASVPCTRCATARASRSTPSMIELLRRVCHGRPIQCRPGTGAAPAVCTGESSSSTAPGTSIHDVSGRKPLHHSTVGVVTALPSARCTASSSAPTTRCGRTRIRPLRASSRSRRSTMASPRRRT